MPIYDSLLLLDNSHHLYTSANYNSQYAINTGVTYPQLGVGGKFGVHVVVTQAFAGVTAGISVDVMTGTAATASTRLITRLLTSTELGTAGNHFFIPVPPANLAKYLRTKYRTGGTYNASAGKVTAWFGPDNDGAR